MYINIHYLYTYIYQSIQFKIFVYILKILSIQIWIIKIYMYTNEKGREEGRIITEITIKIISI